MTQLSKNLAKGFTLLEVLIGMSIMSVMMLLLFASLRICVQNWNAGEKKITQVSEAAIVQGFLRNKLQQALPLTDILSKKREFSFQGKAQKIQFVAPMAASAARLGLQLFTLTLKPEDNQLGGQLAVDIKPFFASGAEADWKPEEIIILKHIQQLQFEYFEKNNDQGQWHSEWVDKQVLPRLVRITIELENGLLWPPIIIALRIDAATGASAVNTGLNPFGIINGRFTSP